MIDKYKKVLDTKEIRFWEFRNVDAEINNIQVWNDNIKSISTNLRNGCSLRILYNNVFAFAHFKEENAKEEINKLLKFAKSLSSSVKTKKSIYLGKQIRKTAKSRVKIKPADVSLSEKKKLLLNESKIALKEKKISNSQIMYYDFDINKHYQNSIGSRISQNLIYTYAGADIVAKEGNVIESFHSRFGDMRGYEIMNKLPKTREISVKKAKSLLRAVTPKGGVFPVVCDGHLTDVFIHEAVGHACEADIVLQKDSCLEGMKGKTVANSNVTIYDDATGKLWGSYFFDDEGIPAEKTCLIRKGVLKGYLHSRETAPMFKAKPTGNGRAQSVNFMPIVRMSNTYLEKGNYKRNELFEGIKKGVYLAGSRGGQVNTLKGNFQFSASEGYLIENGRLTKRLKGVSLAGKTLDILNNISRISNKYEDGFPGHCGKGGQFVQVVGDCPSIMINKAVVGGK